MGDNDSAQEPTNFPVGNRDEVPSESPEKVETPDNPGSKVVPNDTPEQDVADAKAAREGDNSPATSGSPQGTPVAGGDSVESPTTDPNRAAAKPAADEATDKLDK